MDFRLDTYTDTLDYLCRPTRREDYPPDPLPLRALLTRLGHPEHAVNAIRVVGSRGKSTLATLVSNALQVAGYRVGLFTSPHLHSLRERLRIDGEPISQQEWLDQVRALAPAIETGPGPFSTFELLTALAFWWFAQQTVDIAVFEAGVGGRYDAINEVLSNTALITPIELEHQDMLGYTLAEIAAHKAGIVSDGNLVISAPQPREAQAVIEATAAERGALLVRLADIAGWQERLPSDGLCLSHYQITCGKQTITGRTPLLGQHNVQHIAHTLAWAEMIARRNHIRVDATHIVQAAERTCFPGHAEMVRWGRSGSILLDAAHTPASALALANLVEELHPPSTTYVVSIAYHKDLPGFLHNLHIRSTDHLILTMYLGHRAAPLDVLQQAALCVGLTPEIIHRYPDALDAARIRHRDNGLVVVTGSQTFVAQAREHLNLVSPDERQEAVRTRAVFASPGYYLRQAVGREWLDDNWWLQSIA